MWIFSATEGDMLSTIVKLFLLTVTLTSRLVTLAVKRVVKVAFCKGRSKKRDFWALFNVAARSPNRGLVFEWGHFGLELLHLC